MISDTEAFDKMQNAMDSLSESISAMQRDFEAKKAVTLELVPPAEREFAKSMTGSLILTNLGTISYVAGYYGSSRSESHKDTDREYSREAVVALVDIGPREDANFGRGHVHGNFVSKYDGPAMFGSRLLPGTGGPDPDDYGEYGLPEAQSWDIDDRVEAYLDLYRQGVFEHLQVGGFDQQEGLWDAVKDPELTGDGGYPVADVFPDRTADDLPEVVVADDPQRT